jgi:hypothetical protein
MRRNNQWRIKEILRLRERTTEELTDMTRMDSQKAGRPTLSFEV